HLELPGRRKRLESAEHAREMSSPPQKPGQETTMDIPDQDKTGAAVMERPKSKGKSNNGHRNGAEGTAQELSLVLASLQSMRDGDFSVRLPVDWTGLPGKIADTFNEIVAANQQMAQELKRVGQVVGKEGRTRERTRFHQSRGAWGEMGGSVNTLVEDLLRPTTE